MIPLAKILELRKKRSAAVACDAADDTECTKDDPSTCRIHGKKALAETDAEDKSKRSHVNPYGGKPMSVEEAKVSCLSVADAIVFRGTNKFVFSEDADDESKQASLEVTEVCDGEGVSEEETVIAIGETVSYLKARFPNIKIPKVFAFVAGKPFEVDKGGMIVSYTSEHTNDKRYGVVVYAPVPNENSTSYNHGDYRNSYDYIRHEIGHLIAMSNGMDGSVFRERMIEKIGEEEFNKKMSTISQYAFDDKPMGEAIAESFAAYTSNDYKSGKLGNEIEGFLKEFFTGEKA